MSKLEITEKVVIQYDITLEIPTIRINFRVL